jgi:hypothetical protein
LPQARWQLVVRGGEMEISNIWKHTGMRFIVYYRYILLIDMQKLKRRDKNV